MILLGVSTLFSVLFLLWCAASFYLYKTQEAKYYPGDGALFGARPEISALGGQALEAQREGLALRYYEIPPKKGPAKAWIIVYHGNREGAAERADYGRELAAMGFSVALAEYPGYAGDTGPTGEWEILRNALAIFDEIKSRSQALPIFLLGESLGSGVATFVASRRDCLGLVLSTPYTSMADVAAHRYPLLPVRPLTTHPVMAKNWARQVLAPVLILHGTADDTVPYFLGQRQSGNFKNLKAFVTLTGADHSNMREHEGGKFWRSIARFSEDCLKGPA